MATTPSVLLFLRSAPSVSTATATATLRLRPASRLIACPRQPLHTQSIATLRRNHSSPLRLGPRGPLLLSSLPVSVLPNQQVRSKAHSYSTVVVHSRPRSRLRRSISFLLIASASFLIGGYYALHFPPILHPWIMGSTIPTDAETLTLYTPPDDFCRDIDEHIKNCALAQSLRADPSWRESRPHLKIPDAIKQHNLTAGTLATAGGLTVPPYYFNKTDGSEMVQIFYVGTDVSGHPGIVHGGFVATIMDEGLARCAFPAMPNKVGVTANLKIDYRRPTMAGQFLVLRAKTTKVEGRKAWSEGWLESLEVPEGEEPERLVEGSALFVEPKHAKVMKSLYKVASD